MPKTARPTRIPRPAPITTDKGQSARAAQAEPRSPHRSSRPTATRADPEPRQQKSDRRPGQPAEQRGDDPLRRDGGEEPQLAQALNDVEEDGGEEDAEERHADHAAEDGRSQRLPHLGTGPRGDHQGDHAQDEGEGGHEDRPQPQPRGLHRGLVAGPARRVQVPGKLDDEDRILAGQPDQDHQADLHEDVDHPMARQHAGHGTQQAQRHHQDHRQRQRPAFVERGEGQKDAHHGQGENIERGVAVADLHEHQLGPFGLHRQRQRLAGQAIDVGDHVAGADPGLQVAGDRGCRAGVVAVDENRPADLAHVGQGAQRHHLSLIVADLQQMDVRDLVAVLALGLGSDLPMAAEDIETVDVQRSEKDPQRLVQVAEGNAQGGRLGPVDIHEKLRRIGAELARDAHQPRLLRQLSDQGVGLLFQDGQSQAARCPRRRA